MSIEARSRLDAVFNAVALEHRPQEHRLDPQHGPGPDELASDAFEFQRMQEARQAPTDHAAEIIRLADSARISDIELID